MHADRTLFLVSTFIFFLGFTSIASAQGNTFDIDELKLDEDSVGSLPRIERNTDFTSRQVGNKKRLRFESGYFDDPLSQPLVSNDDFESEFSGVRLRLRRKVK